MNSSTRSARRDQAIQRLFDSNPAAVNAEVRDLKAAGADVIQLDEPWLQARAEEAWRLALPAIDKALDGIPGPTALHLCFGYADVARDKPNVYAFLPELTASKVEQISIEAALPNLDLTTPSALGSPAALAEICTVLYGWAMTTNDSTLRRGAEEARNRLPELLDAAEQGRSTIITRRGRPVAVLGPIVASGAALGQQPLTPWQGSGRGLWGKDSARTLRRLRGEWNPVYEQSLANTDRLPT